ncbi:hypothetical protein BLNAU_19752 [Blattamonas nauphoetae]|uniref:Uncharacterized protein n=1 Tax=Blattamonas nauphoetae TaxID=2049346 RepID=A0ABQ9X1T4_9EUKA|nr:hypothetical protein BLNAU_19752 [Blattamonas nauphoetae]
MPGRPDDESQPTESAHRHSFVLVHLHPTSPNPLLHMNDAGTLKMSSIEFDGQNKTFSSQLIAVEDGHLQIASSSFSAMQMEFSALIESDGVVEIESCSFSDITRSTLNATVVHTTSEKRSVSVKQTKFLSCFGGSEERWVELTDRNPTAFAQAILEGTFNVSSPIRGVAVNSASSFSL